MNTKTLTAISFAFVTLLAAGCSDESKEKYNEASSQATKAAKTAGEAVSADARTAQDKMKVAADQTKVSAEQTLMTGKVKQALMSANGLEAKNIDVSTEAYKITLKGTVPNKDQKDQAEQLAKAIGGNGFTVINELTVK